jgi:hypothetical protein
MTPDRFSASSQAADVTARQIAASNAGAAAAAAQIAAVHAAVAMRTLVYTVALGDVAGKPGHDDPESETGGRQ